MKIFIAILIISLTLPGWGNPGEKIPEINVKSKISKVTIFPGHANVERRYFGAVQTGLVTLTFDHLPGSIIDSSIRVTGAGSANVRLLNIKVEKSYLSDSRKEEIRELERQVDGLDKKIKILEYRLIGLGKREVLLEKLTKQTAESLATESEESTPPPGLQEWQGMLVFLEKQTVELFKRKRENFTQMDVLKKEKRVIAGNLYDIRHAGDKEEKKIRVDLEVIRAGKLQLTTGYIVPGASWVPSFDLRIDSEAREAEILCSALVSQETGEDWNRVELVLSTAKPMLTKEIPYLTPSYINPVKPGLDGGVIGGIVSGESDFGYDLSGEKEVEEDFPLPIEVGTAKIEETNLGVFLSFRVQHKESVKSDRTPQKAVLYSRKLGLELDHVAVPLKSERAFLKAKIGNTGDTPLLAGKVNVFLDDTFVNTTKMDFLNPGASFDMTVGVDESVTVKREVLPRKTRKKGFVKKKEVVHLGFDIEVKNFRKTPVKIRIFDQLPVAIQKDIQVVSTTLTPQPLKKEEDQEKKGILEWLLDLKAGETQTIKVEYDIVYPKGFAIKELGKSDDDEDRED